MVISAADKHKYPIGTQIVTVEDMRWFGLPLKSVGKVIGYHGDFLHCQMEAESHPTILYPYQVKRLGRKKRELFDIDYDVV